jgi:group I intron endonuclease
MDDILTDTSNIRGLIYIITNTLSKKQYVGQTVSHRKNKGKYRPFGIEGRFKDHLSEAICNTKKKQCWYLNNAIRKDGKDVWKVGLLEECSVKDLDVLEEKYILEYNTLYPTGYNLTKGGKTLPEIQHRFQEPTNTRGKRGGCLVRTDYTRELMSSRSKIHSNDPEVKIKRSTDAKQQHLTKKLSAFKDVKIDLDKIDEYITFAKGRVVVCIDGISVTFCGKHETQDDLFKRANEFIRLLATLPNCSGNPLEP